MRVWRGWFLGFLSLLLTGGSAFAVPERLPAGVEAKLDRDAKVALRRFEVPGATVMVIRKGNVLFTRAFGMRDVAHHLPVRADTLFEIGSITKQFTAAGILQLQEAGRLNIDRPLADYLPDAPHAREVTLRQLLSHTSGLHDYLDGPPAQMYRLASRPTSYSALIGRVAALPLDFPPGSRWSYSNTGYLLLGKVIEKVSGESYRAYLQRHIFDPLRMTSTYTTSDEGHLTNMAIGYHHDGGKLVGAPIIDATWGGAAGFLVTTMGDLAKWDHALRSGRIVTAASYRQMTTSFVTTKNGSANYGLGLFVDSAYGQPRIGHTGGSFGFTTADEYFPHQDVRILAFTNLGDSAPAEPGETLTNIVFADLYPAIAARAQQAAPGENPAVTQIARKSFRELQAGKDYGGFSAHLKGKLTGGPGARFVNLLGPFGAPTQETFKGARGDGKATWYDYVFQFGPGVSLPFAVKIGPDRTVSGLSVG